MTCGLCGSRKGRRYCPAGQKRICPTCCGSKRIVEINCPDDCVYIKGGRAAAWEGRVTEKRRDERRVAVIYTDLSDAQCRLANKTLVGLLAIRSRLPDIDDRLLASAVGIWRKTIETRERGILYEHQADDMRVQVLVSAIKEVFEEEMKRLTHSDRDMLAVLRAVERSLTRTSMEETDPRAFLESISRLVGRLVKENRARGDDALDEPRIIKPDEW
ncbi:MAG: hypothetical protein JXO72_04635 [Vicinamibacteria bacterium]|nr:hypothetical protein [Vicinamibacteria bacterium]